MEMQRQMNQLSDNSDLAIPFSDSFTSIINLFAIDGQNLQCLICLQLASYLLMS